MAEVAAPLERAREAMLTAGVDAVMVASPGMVAFLTGHVVPAQLAHPSRDGRMEKPTIAIVTAEDVATVGPWPDPSHGRSMALVSGGLDDSPAGFDPLVTTACELGIDDGVVALEAAFVPAAAAQGLREGLAGARFRPLDGLLRRVRAQKSESEREGILAALALCDAGQDAARAAVIPGASELDLYCAAVVAMNGVGVDQVLSLGEIQVGRRGERIAGAPTSAPIAVGELAMCDLAPRHANGFWGDSCMTVACGEPSPLQTGDWERLRNALEAGRRMLRPGVAAGDVQRAVTEVLPTMLGHAGHGIGRDHFEEPILLKDNPELLEEGSIIVIEPGIYAEGLGMRIEHAFEVSDDGGIPLSRFDLGL